MPILVSDANIFIDLQESVRETWNLLRARHSGRFPRSLNSRGLHHARFAIETIASLCHALATAQVSRKDASVSGLLHAPSDYSAFE